MDHHPGQKKLAVERRWRLVEVRPNSALTFKCLTFNSALKTAVKLSCWKHRDLKLIDNKQRGWKLMSELKLATKENRRTSQG